MKRLYGWRGVKLRQRDLPSVQASWRPAVDGAWACVNNGEVKLYCEDIKSRRGGKSITIAETACRK